MQHIGDEERRRRLASRHLLSEEARVDTVATVADRLVALHSSDPATVYLAACVRMDEPSIDAVDAALYERRSVVRHHAMRRTIWAMTPEIARAANAGFTRKIAARERRRSADLFGRDEAWFADAVDRVTAIVEHSAEPIGTREVGQLAGDLAEPVVVNRGKKHETTMKPHTRALLQAGFEGRITRARPAGTWTGSQYRWVANADWLGIDWSEPDEMTGATEIVRRWLDRFGPGTLDDIVWWTGSTKALIRRALEGCEAVEVRLDGDDTGYVLPDDAETAGEREDAEPWAALLPGLDPTAMGWKRRDWYLDAGTTRRVTDRNGNIGPTVWVDGQVVGGWVQRPDGTLVHDAPGLSKHHVRLVGAEIERLRSMIGSTRFSVRFPSPNQRGLLA